MALIAMATLPPQPPSPLALGFNACVFCGEFGLQDFALNIALFVPLGVGLALAGWPVWRAAVVALAVSATIELLQFAVIPGRSATLGDVVSNTIGGAVGALLARHWPGLLHPSRRGALMLAAGAAAVWLSLLTLGAWGMGISLPRTVYWTQWQPDLGQFDRYDGRVIEGTLDGRPLPPPFSGGSAVLRQRLAAGPIALAAVATPGTPTERIAPILSVFDEEQVEVLVLGQRGTSLVFRVRSRAADLRLRPPAIALDDFFAVEPDTARDTLRVLAEHRGASLRLSGSRALAGAPRQRAQRFTPLLVWSLFYPADSPVGRLSDVLTALTAMVLLLPLAYWARRGFAGNAVPVAVAASLVGMGLGVLPPLFGLAVAPWWQWLAALGAVALGTRLGVAGVGSSQRARTTRGGSES